MNINFIIRITDNSVEADLISIYLITDDGDTFYAEFNDYDIERCSKFVKRGILNNLTFPNDVETVHIINDYKLKSDKLQIQRILKIWLEKYKDSDITFEGDKTGFGWYHFLQLIG